MRRRGAETDQELQRVYREHVDAVYAFFAYSVSIQTAEDLTASTFERVIKAWERYDAAKAAERTWILAIARNQLVDHYRRDKHRQVVSLDEHPAIAQMLESPEDPYSRRLDADELRVWTARLSVREREILALRYGSDLPAADIARILDLSAANVHQILSRALRHLREIATAR